MNENELIQKIKQLKEIKPRKEWIVLAKNQILNSDLPAQTGFAEQRNASQLTKIWNILDFLPSLIYPVKNFIFNGVYQRKLAYAFATLVFIMVGVFGFAQYTVPGDLLFSVKRMTEQSQTMFAQDQLRYNFEIANKRLQDLTQIVKENRTDNIAAAVSEFKASMADAAKNLTQSMSGSNKNSLKEIAAEVKKIQDNQRQAETLGIDISQTVGVKELENALASLVQAEITDLEKTSLTEDQQKELEGIRKLYAEGKFSEALEEILLINN